MSPEQAVAYLFGGAQARRQIDQSRGGPLSRPRGRDEQMRRAAQPTDRTNVSPGDVDDVQRYIPHQPRSVA